MKLTGGAVVLWGGHLKPGLEIVRLGSINIIHKRIEPYKLLSGLNCPPHSTTAPPQLHSSAPYKSPYIPQKKLPRTRDSFSTINLKSLVHTTAQKLPLALLMFLIFTDDTNLTVSFDNFALFAHWFY